MNREELRSLIDHTALKPEVARDDVQKLCEEAVRNRFHSVFVNPHWVAAATVFLDRSSVKIGSVAGFPLGASRPEVKSEEARWAIGDGASEIDMVMNVGALRSGDETDVFEDIEAVRRVCGAGTILKVILECALLKPQEKIRAARIAVDAGADFVKTSTSFASGGATVEDVKLLRATVGPGVGVKASGGIRDLDAALAMVGAGANRLGTSSGVAIVS